MSDLISRNKLIDYFYFGIDDKPIIDGIADRKIIDIIKKQPTAYDIDKVVEELEIERKTANDTYNSFNMDVDLGRVFGLEKAIEIVKQGGVADDVCVWNCDEYGRYHTECHVLADNDPLEYTYCPYCGKKIKVV